MVLPEWFIQSTVGPIISPRWAAVLLIRVLPFSLGLSLSSPGARLSTKTQAHSWVWLMCWTSSTQTLLTSFYKPPYPPPILATVFLSPTGDSVSTLREQIYWRVTLRITSTNELSRLFHWPSISKVIHWLTWSTVHKVDVAYTWTVNLQLVELVLFRFEKQTNKQKIYLFFLKRNTQLFAVPRFS